MSLRRLHHLAVPFLPGIVCLPLWAYLMTEKGVWIEAFTDYYPMSLAMVVGCFIAGSTPLGGAVVAFPVAVLVIKFTPVQGRDFAVLIQSVGMTAAAYMIAVKKRHMVSAYLVQTSCVANTIGVIFGFCIVLPGFWVNVTYMTYTMVFAGILFYKHTVARRSDMTFTKESKSGDQEDCTWRTMIATASLFVSGVIGGILASKLGSGSDTMAYIFGIFVYNPLFGRHGTEISESSLTVSSVVIMGYTTVVVALIRLVQGDVDREVFLCWGAVLWIVVFGAPVGSLVINPHRETFFRRLFYVLAVAQFATFAVLKIKGNVVAWLVIGSTMLIATLGICIHLLLCLGRDAASVNGSASVEKTSHADGKLAAAAHAERKLADATPLPIPLGFVRAATA